MARTRKINGGGAADADVQIKTYWQKVTSRDNPDPGGVVVYCRQGRGLTGIVLDAIHVLDRRIWQSRLSRENLFQSHQRPSKLQMHAFVTPVAPS